MTATASRRRWRRITVATVVVWGAVIAPWLVSGTAMADPDGPPCPLAMIVMCRLLPMAPDLDEDVDLTRPLPQSPFEVHHDGDD